MPINFRFQVQKQLFCLEYLIKIDLPKRRELRSFLLFLFLPVFQFLYRYQGWSLLFLKTYVGQQKATISKPVMSHSCRSFFRQETLPLLFFLFHTQTAYNNTLVFLIDIKYIYVNDPVEMCISRYAVVI